MLRTLSECGHCVPRKFICAREIVTRRLVRSWLFVVRAWVSCAAVGSWHVTADEPNAGADAGERPAKVRAWDVRTDGDMLVLKGHSTGVLSAAFCRTGFNGCFAAVGPDDKAISLFRCDSIEDA